MFIPYEGLGKILDLLVAAGLKVAPYTDPVGDPTMATNISNITFTTVTGMAAQSFSAQPKDTEGDGMTLTGNPNVFVCTTAPMTPQTIAGFAVYTLVDTTPDKLVMIHEYDQPTTISAIGQSVIAYPKLTLSS